MKQKSVHIQPAPIFSPAVSFFIAPFILAITTFLTYFPSLHYDFQFDDIANITKHFANRKTPITGLAFKSSRWISYALNTMNYQLSKYDPFVYRLINVLFHIAGGLLVFFVFHAALSHLKQQSFFKRNALSLSFCTALLFLMHPVQTQTVSYVIQGQLEGMANIFMMLIAWCFLQSQYTKKKTLSYVLFVIMFLLAFIATGTKEIVIMMPCMLLLLDWFFIAQGDVSSIKKRVWFHLSFALFVFGLFKQLMSPKFVKETITMKTMLGNNVGNVITNKPGEMIVPSTFLISQFKVIAHYIWMFLWPINISVDYDWKLTKTFFSQECLLPFMLLLCFIGVIVWFLKKDRAHPVAFGLLWFFIGLSPRASFIPSTELVADYKTYFSSAGWLFIIALTCVALFKKIVAQLRLRGFSPYAYHPYLALCLCIVFLGTATYKRNTVWRSSEEFWFNILQNAPLKARAYNNYAVALAERKKYVEAIPYLRKAIKMDSHYPDPWNNISVVYNATKRTDMAIESLTQAIKINPGYPEFYNNLSSYLIQKNRLDDAAKMAQMAIEKRPHYGKAYYNLGRTYLARANQQKAYECFKYACMKADFDTFEGFNAYATVSMQLEKFDEAIYAHTRAFNLEPTNLNAQFNLANAYFCKQNYSVARDMYTNIITRFPNEYRAWFNLGEAYVRLGDPKKGLECLKRAKPLEKHVPQYNTRVAQCEQMVQKGITVSKDHNAKIEIQEVKA